MIISVIGSVDTGKSSLIARILIETGTISNRDIYKIEKESKTKQWLPNLIDTNKEEQTKGITIESSLETFSYKDRHYTLVNNPGHNLLINEMIKHSTQSDIAILVISAKPNETSKSILNGFEHALILRVNGIKTLIICINKSEFINSNSNSFDMIKTEINKTIKKLNFDKVIYCPISAKLNLNILKNDSNLVKYSLLDIIENMKIPTRETILIKPINNTIRCKLFFHKPPKIITIGYQCLLHSLNNTYQVEFTDIKNGNINFITPVNSKNKFISCTLKTTSNDHIDKNTILRNETNTIAYGLLY